MAKKKTSQKKSVGKTGNSVEPTALFEIIGGKRRILRSDGRLINLAEGIPADAYTLYKSGFKHLGLKEGAEILFKKESKTEIRRLIAQASRAEDVEILKKVLK